MQDEPEQAFAAGDATAPSAEGNAQVENVTKGSGARVGEEATSAERELTPRAGSGAAGDSQGLVADQAADGDVPLVTGAVVEEHRGGVSGAMIVIAFLVVAFVVAGGLFFLRDSLTLRKGYDCSQESALDRTSYEEHLDRLETFIADAAGRGYSRMIIREKLLLAGWEQEMVDRELGRYFD
ncbi:MAG: hypothetical protein HC945_02445 [Nitrosarchaeum sp.]|nr:hypothetical protein [Nitrosarchaeum sp.]